MLWQEFKQTFKLLCLFSGTVLSTISLQQEGTAFKSQPGPFYLEFARSSFSFFPMQYTKVPLNALFYVHAWLNGKWAALVLRFINSDDSKAHQTTVSHSSSHTHTDGVVYVWLTLWRSLCWDGCSDGCLGASLGCLCLVVPFSSSLVVSLWDSCGLFSWAEREISPYGRLLSFVFFLAATLSEFWWTAPGLVCRLAAVVVVAPFRFLLAFATFVSL